MNILPIIPNLQTKNSPKSNHLNNITVIQPKLVQALTRDTVSFTGTSKISDFVAKGVSDNMDRLQRIATTYLDVLESVAFRLKNDGISFDRAYAELHPVKSPESYTSKVVRSGTFKVPDTIRATIYMNNPYDLSVLNDKLLPEMKKRGYILSITETTVEKLMQRGYRPTPHEAKNLSKEKLVHDLDIRLEDVSSEITKLSPELRYSIGKPQKSGYEDIQMRFVRYFDKKKNPVQHELIILFGPNYSKAKQEESEKVYSFLRLFGELNMKFTDDTIGSHSNKANRYIELIEQMFRGKVSQKLFLNAKNQDLYDIQEQIPITFSKTDKNLFDNYFSGLNDRLNSSYKEAKRAAQASATATKQLNSDLRHDRTILNKIQEGLNNTMQYYNNKNGLVKFKD